MMLAAGRAADIYRVPSLLESPPAPAAATPRASAGRRLLAAFQAFEGFPALRRARYEMLAAIPAASSNPARLINVVESDPALTIEVLRAGARSSRGSKRGGGPPAPRRTQAGGRPRRARAADGRPARADRARRRHLRLLRAVAPVERRRRP